MTLPTIAPIDELAGWVQLLREATEKKKLAEEVITQARAKIEEALGDTEIGTVAGVPVVRWSHVESNRFDQKKARELLTPEQYSACQTLSISRRFSIVEDQDAP